MLEYKNKNLTKLEDLGEFNLIDLLTKDLKIIEDDLELDSSDQPIFIYDRDVIAQDMRHSIRESGLLELLIGERSQAQRALVFNKIRILIETDTRINPGTSAIKAIEIDNLLITAETEFGPIDMGATL